MKDESQLEHVFSKVADLMEEENFEAAVTLLDEHLADFPNNPRLLYMKACFVSELGQTDLAIELYKKSAANAGEMAVNPLFNLGNLYKDLDDFPNALETYSKVVELDPSVTDAWINMGFMLDNHGEHERALECYDIAIQIDDEDPMTWSNRGNTLRALNQHQEAEKSYRRALELDIDDFASQIGVAVCMTQRGDHHGIQLLEKSLEESGHPIAAFELATALASLDRYSEAAEVFEQLAEAGMDEPAFWNNYAESLAKLSRTDEALEYFDRAIQGNPEFEAAYFGKARLLQTQNRFQEARPVIEKMLEVASEEFKAQPSVRALVTLAVSGPDPSNN